MASPVMRAPVCPINLNPDCLIVRTGVRGQADAGRLILGLVLGDGIVCNSNGLSVNPCYVQSSQFRKKFTTVFAEGKMITEGITK